MLRLLFIMLFCFICIDLFAFPARMQRDAEIVIREVIDDFEDVLSGNDEADVIEFFFEDEANNYDEIIDRVNDLYNDYVVINVNIIIESVVLSDDSKSAMVEFLWTGILEHADEEGDALVNVAGKTSMRMRLGYQDRWKVVSLSGDRVLGII